MGIDATDTDTRIDGSTDAGIDTAYFYMSLLNSFLYIVLGLIG